MLRRRLLFRLATSEAFERVAPKRRAWRSARRYVAGKTLEDALATVGRLNDAGLKASVDLFGERTAQAEAPEVAAAYERLCHRLPARAWVSLDLSHIAFDGGLLDRIARRAAVARAAAGGRRGGRADRPRAGPRHRARRAVGGDAAGQPAPLPAGCRSARGGRA